MKKFFSLVLALVMALSLTTIAWGADPVVAKVGDTEYTDLQAAIVAAAPAGTVEIVDDVTVAEWKMFAETMTHADIITRNINGLTINGNGKTLTVNSIVSGGNGGYLFYAAEKLNINNLTITYGTGVNGGISLKAGTLDTVTFAGGNGVLPGAGDVTIKNCVFNTTGQAIYYEEARPNLEITDNEFNVADTANVIILRGGETFTENEVNSGRTVNIKNDTTTVSGNTFNTRVKLYEEGQELSGNSFTEDAKIDIEDGVTEVNVSGNYWGGGAPSEDQIPAAIADKVAVDSYATAVDADGTPSVMIYAATGTTDPVLEKKATTYENLYAKDTNAPLVAADVVDIVVTPAKAPKYDKTTGALKTPGEVEHVNITADPADYVFVNTLADADVVLYKDAACKQVMFYLAAVNTPEYAEGVLFTNFGEDCGEVEYDDYDKTETYFTAKGDLFGEIVVADKDGSFNVMYGGKLVAVEFIGYSTAYDSVDHKSVYTIKNGVVESIECGVCGLKAVKVANVMSLPKGADVVTGETVWYWPAAVADTTTDTKVESAETFDAGIAMYVGMSVMAAAGSAVVLKKRED